MYSKQQHAVLAYVQPAAAAAAAAQAALLVHTAPAPHNYYYSMYAV